MFRLRIPDMDSDLEALYDSLANQAPVYYDDAQQGPSGSEADLANSKSLYTDDQNYRNTVHAIRSYMNWSFTPAHEYACPSLQDNSRTGSRLVYQDYICHNADADGYFCCKFEQVNLHFLHGHVYRSGDITGCKRISSLSQFQVPVQVVYSTSRPRHSFFLSK